MHRRTNQSPECNIRNNISRLVDLYISLAAVGLMDTATPHSGSAVANNGRAIANIIQACSPFRPARGLLSSLRKDSKVLFEITEDFVEKASNLQIVSFFEMEMTSFGIFKRLVRYHNSPSFRRSLIASLDCGTTLSYPQFAQRDSNRSICRPSRNRTILFHE